MISVPQTEESSKPIVCIEYVEVNTHTQTHTHTRIYIYIYIYIEREREREGGKRREGVIY